MRAAGEAEEQVGPFACQPLRAEGLAILGFQREVRHLGGLRQNVDALGPERFGILAHATCGHRPEEDRGGY